MALRFPRDIDAGILSRADGVEAEILQEKAATLQRLGQRLVDALRDLEELGVEAAAASADVSERREQLLSAAGEALWYYVVQREVCGLRDTDAVMRELRVPRDVQLRMGLASIRRKGA